ncbi:MAG: arsenate reductase [Actinomycetota bacterium]|nr:arsenate reductase [Actinomycetota bacterium]
MADVTIYHNPRCSKSRAALEVIGDLGVDVDVVRSLDDPPDAATLAAIVATLEGPPSALVRRDDWSALGITAEDVDTPEGVVAVLDRHPQLLERPLLVTTDRAVIGRRTERVRDLLGSEARASVDGRAAQPLRLAPAPLVVHPPPL